MTLLEGLDLGGHLGDEGVGSLKLLLHTVLLELQLLDLLSLALPRVVGGEAVPLDPLDAALLLLILGLRSLARRQVGLGLGEHLPPRLTLLRA